MQFGLPENSIESIQKVFEEHSKVDEVMVFGSRAKGNYRPDSDIDLALKGRNISFDDILTLSGKLDELTLPYKIDLVDYNTISEKELVSHIDRAGAVFYERWKKYRLGDLVEIKGGKRLPKGELLVNYDTGHPYIRVTDLGKKWIKKDGLLFVTPEIQRNIRRYTVKGGDVILSIVGSIGITGRISNELNTANLTENCVKFILKSNTLDNDFLYYFLSSNIGQDEIDKRVVGSTQPKLPLYNIKDIEITIPPYLEQISISSILSSLDEKIDLLSRQNKTLEQLAETIFRQWFVEEAEENWKKGKLIDVIDLVYGKALKEEMRAGTGFPVVGSSGIVGYHSEYFVEGPGIVIGRKGTLGQVIYLVENFFPIDTTYFVKSKVNSVGLFYEYFLIKTLNFEEMNSDSAVPGLNRDIALSSEIKIPAKDVISKFNTECSYSFEKIKTNTNQIKSLIQLRNTLLPKLISGEVRVELN